MWAAFLSLIVVLLYATAVFFAVRAAQTARTPQGAVGWVVFLMTLPWASVPLYMFLGHHRFRGYRIARRESERVVAGLKAHADAIAPDPLSLSVNARPFEQIAHMVISRGNGARLLTDGDATFQAIFAAIDAAQSYVLVQFYIVRDDELGLELQDRLIAAARRGVRVRFMTDAIGSHGLPESYFRDLRDAGIDVADPRDQRGPNFRFQINYRNHRKTVVVDGKTGFIGGHNVGNEYLGQDPVFGNWRDTHVEISGPSVLQLQLIFCEDWHWAHGEELLDELFWQSVLDPQDRNALIVATGPGDGSETGSMMFFSAIAAAQQRFWIASPYFVPDLDILAALKNAAMRGVDVRLLVPDVADHRIPWLAAFSYFDEIRAAGVRVMRYTDGFLHQKVFVVDRSIAAVGTTNLDNRSFRLNFEAMALFFDEDLAEEMAQMLERDFCHSFELTEPLSAQPSYIRYGAPLARLFAPIL
ncbi:cardiolipin synthase [Ruegeria sp. WL0004]|uniref:Cardiolipin synthase n=1 Tax=Ruegeria marisflavi TaxID=2984152 RepID=A0ABT2WMM9_9RHOB|nr:cardiolipin synthase [Ruegeria sp. WL0004]MCU9837152.1 cardiolipin synthase [Ruegeria sp. WL0004]